MANVPDFSPKNTRMFPWPLAGAGISGALYALWLTSKEGKKWADEQTWATVVAGTSLTLAWYALEDRRAAGRAWLYFAFAGTPLVIRSLWLQLRQSEAVYRYLIDGD